VVIQGGEVLIQGACVSVGGVPRNNFARLKPDGTLDWDCQIFGRNDQRRFLTRKFTGLTSSSQTLASLGVTNQAGLEQDGNEGIQFVHTLPYNKFATWNFGFPGVGGAIRFNNNPDGDGFKNGFEKYIGTDPSKSSTRLRSHSASGGGLKLRHTRTTLPFLISAPAINGRPTRFTGLTRARAVPRGERDHRHLDGHRSRLS
jgi:hypothetical protein